jgi:hypothetical protein
MKILIINDCEDLRRLSKLKDDGKHTIFIDITKNFGIIIDNEETAMVFKLFDPSNNTSISNIEKLIAEIYNNLTFNRENKSITFLDLKEANRILPIKADDIKILAHLNGNIDLIDAINRLDNYCDFTTYFESRVKIYRLVKDLNYKFGASIKDIIYDALPAYIEMEKKGFLFDNKNLDQIRTQDVRNNRIYFNYNIIGTITGRTSSKIHPLSKDIKKYIYPDKDHVFVEFDYNAAEARILAHYSEDDNLLDIFNNDNDLHKINAALIFDKKNEAEITAQERSVAKLVFFSIINGISLNTLQKDLKKYKVEEDTTKKTKAAIQKIYSKAWSWVDKTQKDAIADKCVINMFGRKRYLSKEIEEDEARAKKQASNTKIQSTLSDIKLIALHDIRQKYKGILVAEFHDSVIVELKFDNNINNVIKDIVEIMSNIGVKYNLKCPLKCNFEIKKHL